MSKISIVISKSRSFFLKLVAIYVVYVIVVAFFYPSLSKTSFANNYVSAMVLILGITLFVQYCFTINYSLLLQAAQRYYVASCTSIVLQIVNAVLTIILVINGLDILVVKFVSSLVFMINPLILRRYIKKNYPGISLNTKSDFSIPQKKDSLIHNLTYVIRGNTDIVLITLFLGVTQVSVYAVYNMVVSSIRRLMESFSNGTQAAFGDMLAKNQIELIKHNFSVFEQVVDIVSSVIFTVTTAMILPFVTIYTKGVNDVSYIQPLFAYLLVAAEAMYIYRLPYHTLVKASASFKETKNSAVIEAVLNLSISIILLHNFGMEGVAIGTFVSMLYRTIYYIAFFSNRIIMLNSKRSLIKIFVNFLVCVLIVLLTRNQVNAFAITVVKWILCSCGIGILASLVLLCVNYLFFQYETKSALSFIIKKFSN